MTRWPIRETRIRHATYMHVYVPDCLSNADTTVHNSHPVRGLVEVDVIDTNKVDVFHVDVEQASAVLSDSHALSPNTQIQLSTLTARQPETHIQFPHELC